MNRRINPHVWPCSKTRDKLQLTERTYTRPNTTPRVDVAVLYCCRRRRLLLARSSLNSYNNNKNNNNHRKNDHSTLCASTIRSVGIFLTVILHEIFGRECLLSKYVIQYDIIMLIVGISDL